MKYNFSMFFNKRYLFQGLALYYSLEKFCLDFKIWVLCMDKETYDLLAKLNLRGMELVSLNELENPELLSIKHETDRNYFWTVKSSFILYVLQKNPGIDSITYLDSDLFFYSSPAQFLDSFLHSATDNILVVPHRYSEKRKYMENRYGIFNSGVASFKNNEIGLACLNEWSQKCIQYCSTRAGTGTFADQHYMDNWPQKFTGVLVFEGLGANLAPWNVKQFNIKKKGDVVYVNRDPLIFYHFSSFRVYSPEDFLLFDYSFKLSRRIKVLVYKPYTKAVRKVIEMVEDSEPSFDPGFDAKPLFWKFLRYKIKYNIVKIHILLKEKVPFYSKIFYRYKK